jgi:hypothetical protein
MSSLNKDNIIINVQDSNLNNDLSNDLNNNVSAKISSTISNKDKKQNIDIANTNTNKNNNNQNINTNTNTIITKEPIDTITVYPIEHFEKKFSKCCKKGNDYVINDFDTIYKIIIDLKTLNNMQKNIILVRFNRISTYCLKNYKTISNNYTFSKLFIISCGILNPALLSINSNKDNLYYTLIYWTVWILQLSVSLITSYVSFYKWDRKYFLYNSYRSKINQEIWYYLELTGKYNIKDDEDSIITHDSRFNLFLERIESLFRKLKNSDLEIEVSEDEKKDDVKGNYSNLNPTPAPDYNYPVQQIQNAENEN